MKTVRLLIQPFLILTSCLLAAEAQAYSLLQPGVRGWVEGQVTFDYDFSKCDRSKEELLLAFDRAISLWNSVPTAKVKIHRGIQVQGVDPAGLMVRITPGNAIIACSTSFKSDTGRDPAYTLAVGGAAVDDLGRIGFGYAVLNSDPIARYTMANIDTEELAAVIGHEFGHSLGLGHSDDTTALMHAEAVSAPSLAQDDVDGITSLYARPPSADEDQGNLFGCATVTIVGASKGPGSGPRGGLGAETFGSRDVRGLTELALLLLLGYLASLALRGRRQPGLEMA
jgi:hypothetical protein